MSTTIRFGTGVISNAGLENTNLLDLVTGGNTELTGANFHIENRNFYAYLDTVTGGGAAAGNATFQSAAMAGAEFAQKIADMGHGGRVTDLAAENTTADIVTITAHGLIGNNDLGSLTNGGIGFNGDAAGFGVDNAPESGARWINTADALDFAVQSSNGQEQAIRTFSFKVDVNGTGSRNVLIDFDGNVARETNPLQNVQLVGSMATRTQQDAFNLGAFDEGDTVTLNFDAKTITVNGVTTALSSAITAAFEAAGVDNVTIGAERTDNLGFSISNVEIGTVNSFALPPGGIAAGTPVLSFDLWVNGQGSRINGFNERELYAYLDADGDNVVDAGEVASAERLGQQGLGQNGDPNGDGDDNITQGTGTTNWLDIYALGVDVAAPAAAFQYGDLVAGDLGTGGRFRFGVDSSASPATITFGPDGQPTDVAAASGNWGDASGGNTVDGGETIGIILRQQDASAVRIAYDLGVDSNPATTADMIVRLYQGGNLIETFTHDIVGATGVVTVQDNLFQAFDRVEIQAAGAKATGAVVPVLDSAEFRITDLDFVLIA